MGCLHQQALQNTPLASSVDRKRREKRQPVSRGLHPVSEENEILVIEGQTWLAKGCHIAMLLQHITLAQYSPRRVVRLARSDQSAGHVEPCNDHLLIPS